jgi:hypothetical protein
VQLGERGELLSRCTTREEGFGLFREIVCGHLPSAVPEPRQDQSHLPSMSELMVAETSERVVEWRPLVPRLKSSA